MVQQMLTGKILALENQQITFDRKPGKTNHSRFSSNRLMTTSRYVAKLFECAPESKIRAFAEEEEILDLKIKRSETQISRTTSVQIDDSLRKLDGELATRSFDIVGT